MCCGSYVPFGGTSQQVVARQSGYHGEPFKATRGVTQGDIVSPTLFNIIVDAVVRYWFHVLEMDETASPRIGIPHFRSSKLVCFSPLFAF